MKKDEKQKKIKIDHFIEDKKDRVEVKMRGIKSNVDFNKLKSLGFVKQKQKNLFTVRCACPGGRVPIKRLKKMIEAAEKYGNGYVHLTARQGLEIPYVHHKDFDRVIDLLAKAKGEIGSGGPRVRVPTACGGCEYNPHGLMDTQKMCQMVYKKFFGHPCNHKFKISFSGCPHDCVRTNDIDLGFQGAVLPGFSDKKCVRCGTCSYACKERAIKPDKEGMPVFTQKNCVLCGDCIRVCPREAWVVDKRGYIVRVGGKHGVHPLNGSVIARLVSDSKVAPIIKKTLQWYNKEGTSKGKIRIGEILRKGSNMENYMVFMKNVLGEYAEKKVRKPELIRTLN